MAGLTHVQKRYIKKNIRKITVDEIASNLHLDKNEILIYLKERWGEEKLKKVNSNDKNLYNWHSLKQILKKNWSSILFLTVLVFAAYTNAVSNAFVSDDISGITQNKNIGNFNYILSHATNLRDFLYFIIYKIFGLNPIFYRLMNIFSHLGTVLILYILILFLTSRPILALFTSSIFAVHPILSESITWISAGSYTQYAFFLLSAFFLYIFAKNNKYLYFLALFLTIISLAFNEKAIIFPIILVFFEISFSQLNKNWKRIVPFFLTSTAWMFILINWFGFRTTRLTTNFYQQDSNGLQNPLLQIPIAVTSYLQLIFWPGELTLYHSEMFFSQFEYILRLLIFIGFIGVIGYFYKKNKMIFFWLAFFIISLLPTLTPLKVGWIVAERYVYLGTIGIIFVFSYFLYKISEDKKYATLVYFIFIIAVLSLLVRTIVRNVDWKNEDNLYISIGKTSPSSPNTHNNLGDVYGRRGDLQRAVYEFKKAIEINPNYADAYHNLANAYNNMGKFEEALESYQKAAKLNPRLWQSYQNIAALYFNQGDYKLAEENMKKAIKILPQNDNLYLNLTIMYIKMNEKEKAKKALSKALEINPKNEQVKIVQKELESKLK